MAVSVDWQLYYEFSIKCRWLFGLCCEICFWQYLSVCMYTRVFQNYPDNTTFKKRIDTCLWDNILFDKIGGFTLLSNQNRGCWRQLENFKRTFIKWHLIWKEIKTKTNAAFKIFVRCLNKKRRLKTCMNFNTGIVG